MSALTRILNNQIYSKTIIASQKIADGTITGSLFSSNVTIPGDFLITGNLFVLGTSAYTTIASTNTYVNDPLIVLNNGFAGTNTYDEGFIFNRGSLQNRALIWSEFNQEFRLIGTTETGTAYGNVAVSNFANLHIGNLTVDYTITHTGNFFTNGFINTTANISAATGLFGAVNSTGFINTTGNISAAVGLFGAINSTGYINTSGNISTAQLNAGQINTTGNVLASTVGASFLTASTVAVGNISAVIIGNTGAVVQGLTAQFDGNVIGGLAQFAAINSTPIGNATASTGTFTVLAANNNLWANASIATTTQGTGAVVVPNGGISVAGAGNIAGALTVGGATQLNSTLGVGGITTFTNSTNATSIADGAVRIQGGASVSKDLYVGGNLYAANIVGITANVITVEDPLLFLKPSYTFPYNYDIGIYSSFQGAGLTTAGNVLQHTGVVRHQETNTWTFASNLAEPGGGHVVFDNNTVYDPIKAGNLQLTVTTDSTNATTGALIVAGGAGIGGNIFHSGTQLQTSAGNYIFATTPTVVDAFKAATTLNIGATSGTITLSNPTVVGTQATQALYNTTATTMNFAGAATDITMGATSGTANLRVGNVWLSNLTTLDGAQTDINVFTQSATNANLLVKANVTIGGNVGVTTINNPILRLGAGNIWFPIGGTLDFAATGITTLNVGGDATTINMGATSGLTSVRTSLEAKGVLYANVAAESTTAANGGLVVFRGAGIGGSLNVGNSAVFNSGLTTGTFQIKSSTSGNVALFANLSAGPGTSESVIIGGGNTVIQSGVTLKVNSTTTMMVPVGPTSSRPSSVFGAGYDVAGMIRFNNTINNLEFYDGTNWAAAGSTFTVISDRQFAGNVGGGFGNVDGTNTTYTIQSNSTTAGSIVSINGVMQFPTLAYSVTGNQLTFTEPPAPGDVIDVRIITTTTTVSTLASGNGLNQFIAADTGAQIWTGTSSTTERIEVDTAGNFNFLTGNKVTYDQTVVSVPNTNLTLLDSFSANSYTTSKYVISMKQGTGNVQAMEALLTQSTVGSTAGTAYVTTYGIVNTGNTMGTLAANVDVSGSWTVKLWLIPNAGTAISNVKVMTTYIV